MQKMRALCLAGALCALATPALAQETNTALQPAVGVEVAPPPIAAPPNANAVLRAGTPITVRLLEEVTTKDKAARVGQRIKMEVAAPVEVNGVVVIPAGSPAEGEVVSVRNKGMWGKSGRLEARVLYTRVNGRQIRLTGTFDDKGVTGTAGVIGAVALAPIVGFFVTGTSAVLPMGGEVPVFVDEDVQLAMVAAAPAPLVVEAPAPLAIGSAVTAQGQPASATSTASAPSEEE